MLRQDGQWTATSRCPWEATASTAPRHHACDARWREGPSAWLLDRQHGSCAHVPAGRGALQTWPTLATGSGPLHTAPGSEVCSCLPPPFPSPSFSLSLFFTPGSLCGHHDVLSWPSADPLFPTCSWTRPRSLLTLLGTPLCRLFAAPFQALIPGRETTLEGTAPKIPKANSDPSVRWI